jgi:hypothetical protein
LAYGHQHQLPPLQYKLTRPKSTYAKCMTAGLERAIGAELSANLELYNKNYYNVVTIDQSRGSYGFGTTGRGFARGIEISIKKQESDAVFGWISYAYSLAKRSSPYDTALTPMTAYRPHMFNVAIGTRFRRDFEAGIKFQWFSGSPWEYIIGATWDFARQKWAAVYAPDKGQLPAYLRLDVHLQKGFSALGLDGDVYLAVLNVTDHRNIQSYFYSSDYKTRKAFYMIPRIPLLGLRLTF